MPLDHEKFADMVVLTVKAALAPVLDRLSAAEQSNLELKAMLGGLPELRDRLIVMETKAALVVTPAASGPSAAELELLLRDRLEPLVKTMDGLTLRVTAVEAKPEPVATTTTTPPAIGPTAAETELTLRDRLEPVTKSLALLSERVAVMEVRAPVAGPAGQDGKNGLDGKDGADGLGFDDMDVEFDGDRTVLLKFARGTKAKSWPLVFPFQKYQGVYQQGKSYDMGDTVSWGSQLWHCNESTVTPPGDGSKFWQLCVRKGRDGKDGRDAVSAAPVVSIGARS